KDTVAVFQKHWNEYVSPGEAMYAHRDDSRELIQQAKLNGQVPRTAIRTKEVFLTSDAQGKARPSTATPQHSNEKNPAPTPPAPAPPLAADPSESAPKRSVNSSRVHRASTPKGSKARRAND
ncbi:MAG: hypothetical protein VB859_09375, partial [Planctomycetaceae bacterium]